MKEKLNYEDVNKKLDEVRIKLENKEIDLKEAKKLNQYYRKLIKEASKEMIRNPGKRIDFFEKNS